ncbi:hypothetical protein SAMN05444338_11590 [Flavobacterium degerlachei]|uniref:Uncharacterized protein n=1 Tax=Flavobacterium degerlachei TaxID=229203 RepID=A0A1H3EQX2_9FLAO|nr:hypothetical protein SAMN05444338_11590 [Flavobacterium degerlachei]
MLTSNENKASSTAGTLAPIEVEILIVFFQKQ